MKSNLRSAAPLALALLCALFVHAQDSKNFQPVGGAASASSRQTWRMSRSHTRNDTVRAQAGDQFHIGMGDFEISYRLGLLFGELVYDYRLRWEFGNGTAERGSAALDVGTLQGKPVRVGVPIRYYEKFGIAGSSLPLDADLLARIAKVRPLKFTFVYNVNLKGRIGLANQKEDTTAKPDFDLLKRSRHSSIDQPEAAGVAQSFSVPGSPKWSEMPDYFRDLFKAAKQPDDVVVTDLYPVEIRWPQYELESIIAEQLNRNRKKLASAAAGRADFWDAPVQAAEQPVIVSGDASKDKPAASDKDKAAQELAKRLESARNAPATATDVQLNTLRLEHDAALGNVEYVVLDAAGKELARHGRSASNRSLEIAAVPGTARIELRKDGQTIAAMPWTYIKPGQALIRLPDIDARYSHQLFVYWNAVAVGALNVGTKGAKLYLPDGFREEHIGELRFSTRGAAAHATAIHNSKVDYYRERDKGSSGFVFPNGEQGLKYQLFLDLAGKTLLANFNMTKLVPHRPVNYHTFSEFDRAQLKFDPKS